MSEIFDNAVDSLEVGIGVWLDDERETAPKHAILNIFHAVELLLKERLSREHPLLIFRNIDKPISDSSETVGFAEIFTRYKNIGIVLPSEDIKILWDLKKRRNRIEHHSFKLEPSHTYVVGKALRFIYYFLRNQLGVELEEILSNNELYEKARQEILDYEEQLAEALAAVKVQTTPRTKDDLETMQAAAYCPDCGMETVVIRSERGDYCYLCREEKSMEQCPVCGAYVASTELEDMEICSSCEEERW